MQLSDYLNKFPLFFLQIGGWMAYIVIDILSHINVGYYFYAQSITYGIAALILTSCVALLISRNKASNLIFQSLYFVLILYIAAIIWHKIYRVVHNQTDSPLSVTVAQIFDQNLLEWAQTGYMPLFLFFTWGGFYLSAKWYVTHQAQQRKITRALLDKKQAQLETLRYQLNPHFLFNALNSADVSVLSNDKETAHRTLKHLSAFLRCTLQEGESDKITLVKEFDMIHSFVAIEQLRFSDALEINVNLDEHCRRALIPPMLLQPLVENAIKYAWSQRGTGYVSISTLKQKQSIKINVCNSKTGQTPKSGTRIGLKNTQERLKLLYGTDASLLTTNHENTFKVEVEIPWEEHI